MEYTAVRHHRPFRLFISHPTYAAVWTYSSLFSPMHAVCSPRICPGFLTVKKIMHAPRPTLPGLLSVRSSYVTGV